MSLIELRHRLAVARGHLCHELGVELGLVDGIPGHERTVAWVWSPFGLNGLAVCRRAWPC